MPRPPWSSATTGVATPTSSPRDSAEIFAGAGIRALLLPVCFRAPVPAFAVRHFAADAGVMVTASHNPPDDNGYKVYLGGDDDGAQIVPPVDAEIAAHIRRVADEANVPAIPRSLGYETASESVVEAYVAATAAVAPAPRGRRAVVGVHRDARCGLGDLLPDPGCRGLPFADTRRAADPARWDVPDGRLPESRRARRHGPRVRYRAGDRGRPGHRQRPGCRSAGGRGPGRVGGRRLAPAHGQRDRAPAGVARSAAREPAPAGRRAGAR